MFGKQYKYDISETKNFAEAIKKQISSGKDFANIDLSDIISQFSNLDESVVKAAKDAQASGGGYGAVTSALEVAGKQAENSANKFKKVSTIGKTLLASAANVGISLLVSKALEIGVELYQRQDRLRENAQKYGEEIANVRTQLAKFQSEINSNLEIVNSPTSSLEEVTQARQNLLDIQNQMIDAYGEEAGAIDLVTDALNGQSDAFDSIAKNEYDKLKSDYIDESTKWYEKPFGFFDAWNEMNYDMEKHSMVSSGDATDYLAKLPKSFIPQMNKVLKEFNIEGQALDPQNYALVGNIYDLLDAFTALENADISSYTEEEQAAITSSLTSVIGSIQSIIDKNEDLYMSEQLFEKIDKNAELKKYYNDLNDAKQAYDDAFVTNDQSKINKAIENYAKLYNQMSSFTGDDVGLKNFFDQMTSGMESYVNKFNLEDAIDKDVNGFKSKIESAAAELSNLKTSEIKAYDESKKGLYSDTQVQAFDTLISSAKEYKMTLEDLVDVMSDFGMVNDERFDNLLDQYLSPLQKKGMTTSDIKSLAEEYQSLMDDMARDNVTLSDLQNTVRGNVDLNNRQVLQWTEENLNKYKDTLMEMEGFTTKYKEISPKLFGSFDNYDIFWQKVKNDYKDGVSTVLGSSSEFDGLEIAFTPMLQTDSGTPELLNQETVNKYISSLLEVIHKEHPDGWTTEDLLGADANGLMVNGKKIKNLIADIGDTAIETGQKMHYLGEDGASNLFNKKIKELAKQYNLTEKEVKKQLEDYNKIHSLTPEQLEIAYSIENRGEMSIDELIQKIKDVQTLRGNEVDFKTRANLDAYNEATKNGDHIDDYNSYVALMKQAQELYEAGQIGSEKFKAGAKAFSMNGMTDASNWAENYKELGKYFTEGSTGLETFVKNLESNKIAEWDEATKTWSIDLTDLAGVAKKMNMPLEMLSVLMDGLQQYGFTDDYFGTMADGTQHLTDLTQQLIEERAKLSQMSPDENAYDEQQGIVSSLQERIKKTAKALSDFYKDDGAAEKAYQDKLKERDDVLSDLQTAYKNVSKASGKARDEALEALEPVIEAVENEYGIKIRVDEEGNLHILDDLDTINQKISDTEQKLQQLRLDNGGKLNMDDEEVQQTLSEYEQLLRDKQLLEIPTIMRLDISSLSDDAANTVNKVTDIIKLLEEKDIQLKVNPDADVSDIQQKLDEKLGALSDEDFQILAKLGFQGDTPEEVVRSAMNTDAIPIPAELTLEGDNPILAAVDETNRHLNAIAIKIGAETSDFEEGVDEAVSYADSRHAEITVSTPELRDGTELTNVGAIVTGDQGISDLKDKLDELKGKNITLGVTVPDEATQKKVQELVQNYDELKGDGKVSILIDANTAQFDEGVDAAVEDAKSKNVNIQVTTSSDKDSGLKDGQVHVQATVNGEQDVKDLKDQLNNLPEGTKDVTIDANVTNADQVEKVTALLGSWSQQNKDKYTINGGVKLNGVEYATIKANLLTKAVNQIPKQSKTAISATDTATATINSVKSALNSLDGSKATVSIITLKQTQTTGNGGGSSPFPDLTHHGDANGTFHAPAHATGTDVAIKHDEEAVVNEIAPEGLVRDGVLHEIPGGAQTIKLKRGDIIFNHKQLQELKENGYVTSNGGHGKVVGAAFAHGTVNGLPAHIKGAGSSQGGAFKDKYDFTNTSTGSSGTKSSTSGSGTSGSGSSGKSGSSDDKPQKIDYIEILVSRIERAINNLSTVATSVFHKLSDRLSSTNNELAEIAKEISVQQQGYDRYIQEANSVGLSEDIASKIRDGAIDISQYDSDTSEKIQEYQSWWIFMPRINLFNCGDIPIILSRYNITGNGKCECGTSL